MLEKEKDWIKIMNCSFQRGSLKLSPQELYVYAYLFRSRLKFTDSWKTYTSVDMLLPSLKCKIDGKGNKKFHTLTDVLINLHSKGYISIDVLVDGLKFKKSDRLEITFPSLSEGNWTSISYLLFDTITDRECFYIYCYIASGGEWGKKISYQDLADMLGVVKETVVNRIKIMNKEDSFLRIYKFSGSYINGSVIQEENIYHIKPNTELKQKWNRYYDENGTAKVKRSKKYKDDDIIYIPFFENVAVKDIKDMIYSNESHWFKKDEDSFYDRYAEILIDDYFLYLACKEHKIYPNFVKRATEILRAKRSRYDYDGQYEEWDQDYLRDIQEHEMENVI